MPINFGILQPTQPAQTQVIVTPQQSGGGDGLGGMLGGLQSLFGGIKGSFGANPVSTANQAVQMTMDKTPAAAISQSILPSSMSQAKPNPMTQSTGIQTPQNKMGLQQGASNALSIPGVQQMAAQQFPSNPVMQQLATAQATQESGLLGKPSKLATQQNNLFGMTGKGTAGSQTITGNLDSSPQQFAAYKSPQESMQAYGNLMKNDPRYQKVMSAPDFETAAKEVQKAGYATDKNYANNLISVGKQLSIGNNVNSPAAQVGAIHNAVQASNQPGASPLDVAKSYMGMSAKQNAGTLEGFFQKSGMGKIDPRSTPWCAAFANSVLASSGVNGTGSLAARSFLKWGNPTSSPSQGDIVVTSDLTGRNDPAHGHVGFYAGMSEDGTKVKILGGNESGQVMVKEYPASKVIGYRTPPTAGELQAGAQGGQSQIPAQNIPSVGIQAPQYQQAGILSGGQGQKQNQDNQKPGQQQQSQPGQGSQYNSGQNQFNLLNASFK